MAQRPLSDVDGQFCLPSWEVQVLCSLMCSLGCCLSWHHIESVSTLPSGKIFCCWAGGWNLPMCSLSCPIPYSVSRPNCEMASSCVEDADSYFNQLFVYTGRRDALNSSTSHLSNCLPALGPRILPSGTPAIGFFVMLSWRSRLQKFCITFSTIFIGYTDSPFSHSPFWRPLILVLFP